MRSGDITVHQLKCTNLPKGKFRPGESILSLLYLWGYQECKSSRLEARKSTINVRRSIILGYWTFWYARWGELCFIYKSSNFWLPLMNGHNPTGNLTAPSENSETYLKIHFLHSSPIEQRRNYIRESSQHSTVLRLQN